MTQHAIRVHVSAVLGAALLGLSASAGAEPASTAPSASEAEPPPLPPPSPAPASPAPVSPAPPPPAPPPPLGPPPRATASAPATLPPAPLPDDYSRPQGLPPPWLYEQQPDELPYEEGDPVPLGYAKDTKLRKGLVIAGAVVLGSSWLASVVYGSLRVTSGSDRSALMYVPVAGPALATADEDDGVVSILVADSLAQSTGLILLVVGLAAQKTYLRRVDAGELTVAPVWTRDRAGILLDASF